MTTLTAFWVAHSMIIAATSPEQAGAMYVDMVGAEWALEFGCQPHPLTDADLDERYQDFDEDERPIAGQTFSFRERLAEMTAPGVLADWE